MKVPLPLGGSSKNYDSKLGRGNAINLIPEMNLDGTFKRVVSNEGLLAWQTAGDGPIRSNLWLNSGYVYFVSGDALMRVDANKSVSDLGDVFGSGRAVIRNLGQPGDNEIIVWNGAGDAYAYDSGSGFAKVASNWQQSTHGDVLNERVFAAVENENEVFYSDISDARTYGALSFFQAEENADNVVGIVRKKSTLWVFGEETVEAWLTAPDDNLPVRKIQGATLERGCISKDSIASLGEYTAWLADDGTVRILSGQKMDKISDLDLDKRIRGDSKSAGFAKIDDAVGFWIDGPVHKRYVLTFPTEDYTTTYDLSTGQWFEQTSEGIGRWRGNNAVGAFGKILVGDYTSNQIWELDPQTFDEGGNDLVREIVSDPVVFDFDVTIPLIELEMETGVGLLSGQGSSPEMLVYYSKDGGETWTQASGIDLGAMGEYNTRVPLRFFGRLVRNQPFMLKLRVTDPVEVTFYGGEMYIE